MATPTPAERYIPNAWSTAAPLTDIEYATYKADEASALALLGDGMYSNLGADYARNAKRLMRLEWDHCAYVAHLFASDYARIMAATKVKAAKYGKRGKDGEISLGGALENCTGKETPAITLGRALDILDAACRKAGIEIKIPMVHVLREGQLDTWLAETAKTAVEWARESRAVVAAAKAKAEKKAVA